MDDYAKAIIAHCYKLEPKGSFAIPVKVLQERYKWEISATMGTSLRGMLKKGLNDDVYQRLSVHIEKDHAGVITHVRVRRRPEE
jgi:hypothetical protein